MISVYDLMQKYISCDEETLKEIFVEDVWDWRDVDSQIEIIKTGDEFDKMPASEKTAILKGALMGLDSEARRGEVLAKVADKLEEWRKQHDLGRVDAMINELIKKRKIAADALVMLDDAERREILDEERYNDNTLECAVVYWYETHSMWIKQLNSDSCFGDELYFATGVLGLGDVDFFRDKTCKGLAMTPDDKVMILAKAIKKNVGNCDELVRASIKVELQKWAEEHKAKEAGK